MAHTYPSRNEKIGVILDSPLRWIVFVIIVLLTLMVFSIKAAGMI